MSISYTKKTSNNLKNAYYNYHIKKKGRNIRKVKKIMVINIKKIKKTQLSNDMERYLNEKLRKFNEILGENDEVNVKIEKHKNIYLLKINIKYNKTNIYETMESDEYYDMIDTIITILSKKIEKIESININNQMMFKKNPEKDIKDTENIEDVDFSDTLETKEIEKNIIKTKQVTKNIMTKAEAMDKFVKDNLKSLTFYDKDSNEYFMLCRQNNNINVITL